MKHELYALMGIASQNKTDLASSWIDV